MPHPHLSLEGKQLFKVQNKCHLQFYGCYDGCVNGGELEGSYIFTVLKKGADAFPGRVDSATKSIQWLSNVES